MTLDVFVALTIKSKVCKPEAGKVTSTLSGLSRGECRE